MKAAIASASCLILMVLVLAVRGADDWSSSLGVAWFGLFALAAVLAVVGLVISGRNDETRGGKRTVVVVIALPVLIYLAYVAYEITQVAHSVS